MALEAVKPDSVFHVEKASPEWFAASWAYIRHGLVEVKKNCPATTWIPEQIRRQIERDFRGGPTEFFFCLQGKKVTGFYITLAQIDPWLAIPYVWLVWIAYSSNHGMVDGLVPIILQQAKERGFVAVDFVTANAKLVKHMERHGCVTTMITARKMVE